MSRLDGAPDLLDQGQIEDAFHFANKFRRELSVDAEFPTLQAWLGDQLIASGRASEGIAERRSQGRRTI